MTELETRERLVRVETKLDLTLESIRELTAAVKTAAMHPEECPARKAFLSHELVAAAGDVRRARTIAIAGLTLAVLGGIGNALTMGIAFFKRGM